MFLLKVVDKPSCNTYWTRYFRQAVGGKPVCRAELSRIDLDIPTGILCSEAQHQRIGKGPRLASEVSDIPNLNTHFLHNLSYHTILQVFTGLNKTGYNAVELGSETVALRKEDFVTFGYSYNDCRRNFWIRHQAAFGAGFGMLGH